MRGLSYFYNAGRTYGQVRLGNTTDHVPLPEGYNNFFMALPKSNGSVEGFVSEKIGHNPNG